MTLENIGFSILSTGFSIGFMEIVAENVENFSKKRFCRFC